MGNCWSSSKRQRQPQKFVTLALLGIDNAGKTTAAYSFSGEPIDKDVAPTIGFRNVKFTFEHYDITLYDVGGGRSIRPVWKNYLPEAHGFIYMVDASSRDQLNEARDTFRDTLEHPNVAGKPVLLLANKQDKPGSMDEADLCKELNLEHIVNTNKCLSHIELCTAMKGTGKKMDRHMRSGLQWLLNTVDGQWEALSNRVKSDMSAAEQMRIREAKARRERVRIQREEREKQEEEERQRLGITKTEEEDDDDDIFVGDPFKRLDLNELKKKEDTLKAEKKHRKHLEESLKIQDALPLQDGHSSRLSNNALNNRLSDTLHNGDNQQISSLEPLNTAYLESAASNKKKKKKKDRSRTEPESEEMEFRPRIFDLKDLPQSPERSHGQPSQESVMTLSHIHVSSHEDARSPEINGRQVTMVSPSLPDVSEGGGDTVTPRTRKVKKKKLRQLGANLRRKRLQASEEYDDEDDRYSPKPSPHLRSLDGGDIEDLAGSSRGVAEDEKKRLNLRNGNGHTGQDKYLASPRRVLSRELEDMGPVEKPTSRHSQLHSNVSLQSDPMGSRVSGFNEDLPEVAADTFTLRNQTHTDDLYL